MRVLGTLCSCTFCKGTGAVLLPCGHPALDLGYQCTCGVPVFAHSAVKVGDEVFPLERVVTTQGRRSLWIALDDDEGWIFLSSRQVETPVADLLGLDFEEVGRFQASVHGCWKLQKHQAIVIFRPRREGVER
jgi:hypothetical protein